MIRTLFIAFFATLFLSSCSYNTIVDMDETVGQKWAQVQTQYQRRADLIPNLVNTVKGYAAHEKETLEAVMNARSKATSVTIDAKDLTEENLAKFQAVQNQVSSTLSRLLATVENYPNLKANENFRDLQVQLEGTENRINTARNDFNNAVNAYNTRVRSFPMNLFAGIFGFSVKEGFQAEEGAQNAPQVPENIMTK